MQFKNQFVCLFEIHSDIWLKKYMYERFSFPLSGRYWEYEEIKFGLFLTLANAEKIKVS